MDDYRYKITRTESGPAFTFNRPREKVTEEYTSISLLFDVDGSLLRHGETSRVRDVEEVMRKKFQDGVESAVASDRRKEVLQEILGGMMRIDIDAHLAVEHPGVMEHIDRCLSISGSDRPMKGLVFFLEEISGPAATLPGTELGGPAGTNAGKYALSIPLGMSEDKPGFVYQDPKKKNEPAVLPSLSLLFDCNGVLLNHGEPGAVRDRHDAMREELQRAQAGRPGGPENDIEIGDIRREDFHFHGGRSSIVIDAYLTVVRVIIDGRFARANPGILGIVNHCLSAQYVDRAMSRLLSSMREARMESPAPEQAAPEQAAPEQVPREQVDPDKTDPERVGPEGGAGGLTP